MQGDIHAEVVPQAHRDPAAALAVRASTLPSSERVR